MPKVKMISNIKLEFQKKESDETVYWLEMIETACPKFKDKIIKLHQEAKELNLIFNAIIKKCS